MQTWKFEVTLKVSEAWVADGFNMTKERIEQIEEKLSGELLPYANGNEVTAKVKIITSPDSKVIRKIQGYKD